MSLENMHLRKISENDQTFELVTETPRSFSPIHVNNKKSQTK